MNVEYSTAVAIFAVGAFTSLATAVYIIVQYFKFRNQDPFEGEK